MARNLLFLNLLIFLSIFTIGRSDATDCVYTVYVKTASRDWAGTDSNITLSLYDVNGTSITINGLKAWGGLMGPGHDYYEKGNLDIFSGRSPCLPGPFCSMNLTSDGSGPFPGWYVDYVEVTSTGVDQKCVQQKFVVNQWLDLPPYELTAIRDNCSPTGDGGDLTLVSVI